MRIAVEAEVSEGDVKYGSGKSGDILDDAPSVSF